MKYTKEDAIRTIVSCARAYRDELEDRSLLLITADKYRNVRYTELFFYGYNFLHLTGVKPCKEKVVIQDLGKLDEDEKASLAQKFYENCLNHKLSPSHFEFAADGTTEMKLDILPFLVGKNLNARMLGDYNSSKPRLYTEKLTGGVKGCIGFVVDDVHKVLVPNTVLKEDIRTVTNGTLRVIAIYRKTSHDERYSERTYKAKKLDTEALKIKDADMWIKELLERDEQ